jgi:hypothetical protein
VYHNHLLSCVLLEDKNHGWQIHKKIKQNLPVGLHWLTFIFMQNTNGNKNKRRGIKQYHHTNWKLERKLTVTVMYETESGTLDILLSLKGETYILIEIVPTGKSYIHDGKASVSCNSQHFQTKVACLQNCASLVMLVAHLTLSVCVCVWWGGVF